ncbi:MAG: hypothetical protein DMF46_02330 [Verrucomicrobia bacterium]|nr:MAG: hypothetical protein DMF46_02330 [Verrucomicrobiota bacterium]
MRIENFRVTFDASRASLVSKIMKRRISVTLAIIGACSIAFAREPLPIKWTIDGASLRWTNKIAQHRLDS